MLRKKFSQEEKENRRARMIRQGTLLYGKTNPFYGKKNTKEILEI